MSLSRPTRWTALLLVALLGFLAVAVPMYLIRPFSPQSPGGVALSYQLRRLGPWITAVALFGSVWLGLSLWVRPARWPGRLAIVLLVVLGAGTAWISRQDYFEWMFRPIPDARFVPAAAADFVAPGDVVMAVSEPGDAVAYPVRQLAYHHLINDSAGGVPIVATY